MFKPETINTEIDKILGKVVEIRHYLHAHPELSLKEFGTSKFIRNELKGLDIDILPPFLETDVVALLNGSKPGRNITLRADIDALPIYEQNKFKHRSVNKGVMHACGHDGHTAMLLGAAIILEKLKDQLNGSVRFVFQPGEEMVAGGKDLVEAGVLENPKPDAVFAMHGWPGYPEGAICSRPGNIMAAADHFNIVLKGKGGHGSKPELTDNLIHLSAKIINSIYQMHSINFWAENPVIFSFGKLKAGENANVIPDSMEMAGTVRYFSKKQGDRFYELFEQTLKSECESRGVKYRLRYERPYIPTVNHKDIVEKCRSVVMEEMSRSLWVDIQEPVMSSEDFSYYIDKNPGAMFFLGMGEESPGLHTNVFDFNDKALRNGIKFLVFSILKYY